MVCCQMPRKYKCYAVIWDKISTFMFIRYRGVNGLGVNILVNHHDIWCG